MTFKDFAEHIVKKLQTMSVKDDVKRLDIVLDTYDAFSVKSVTRKERGVGSRVLFEYNDPSPDNNKTDLNKLSSQLAIRPTSWIWAEKFMSLMLKGLEAAVMVMLKSCVA